MGESTPNSVKKSRETRVFKRITLYPPLWLTIFEFGHKEPLLRLKTFDQDKKAKKDNNVETKPRQKRRQNRQKTHSLKREFDIVYQGSFALL